MRATTISVELRKLEHFSLFVIFGFITYFFGILIWPNVSNNEVAQMWVYEILITTVSIFIFISWKKVNGQLFSLFSIFLFFFIVFNAGQFIFWSIGIHYISNVFNELGVARHVRFMDNITLLKIMIVTLPAICFCYAGALMVKMSDKTTRKLENEENVEGNAFKKNLLIVSRVFFVISYVVEMFLTIENARTAIMLGYSSLYYGDNISQNTVFKYISYFFFPSIF